jgi:hypothetical protein
VAETLADERPDLLEHFPRLEIEARAAALFASDLPAESERFQALFSEFNSTYFAGSLPEYRVQVMYAIDDPEDNSCPSAGIIDAEERVIRLRISHDENLMVGSLLYEMAHAATNGEHGTEWVTEMKRLHRLGAPVLPCDLE